MAPINCYGCDIRKRSDDKFYNLDSFGASLEKINQLRTKSNKRKSLNPLETVEPSRKVCRKCYDILATSWNEYDDLPDLSIYRQAAYSHSGCAFSCFKPNDLSLISCELRKKLLFEYKVFTETGSRICLSHRDVGNYWPLVKQIKKQVPVDEFQKVADLMFELNQKIDSNGKMKTLFDPENPSSDWIDEKIFEKWIGYNKARFGTICEHAKPSPPVKVAAFLIKMRTALSNCQIGPLFGLSKSAISNYINDVVEDLYKNLVPKMLNLHSRATLASHCTELAETLFDIGRDQLLIIWDGTYRFVQKSANIEAQKKFWSCQKERPLDKAMVGVCSDGFIAFSFGPFSAKDNDSTILTDCFERFEGVLGTLQAGDTMMADRGFTDAIKYLESHKFKWQIPNCSISKKEQSPTIVANWTRQVTKTRWVVELTFGRLKMKFRLLALPAHNGTLKNDFKKIQIGFALLNLFFEPINSDLLYPEVAEVMKSRLELPNYLKSLVSAYKLTRQRSLFDYFPENDDLLLDNFNAIENGFPQLSWKDLYLISCGPYQLNNAISYYSAHIASNDGMFVVQRYNPEKRPSAPSIDYVNYHLTVSNPVLIKSKLKSRYRSGVTHNQFILADNSLSGRNAIIGYYCDCESGARTVGCCSHVMTIIWYLGYGHNHGCVIPSEGLENLTFAITRRSRPVQSL